MLLKNNNDGDGKKSKKLFKLLFTKKVFQVTLVFTITSIIFLLGVSNGIYHYKSSRIKHFSSYLKNVIYTNFSIIPNAIKGELSRPDVIQIDIKHMDMQRIAFDRELSMDNGVRIDKTTWVPAKMRNGNEEYKVKVKLAGGNLDHMMDENKWSYKFKIKGKKTLFGTKNFAMLVPIGRGNDFHHPVNEWMIHEFEKEQGLLTLRYKYVELIVNGRNQGIYAFEEGFSKYFLEHNSHRESLIFKASKGNITKYYGAKKIKESKTLQSNQKRVNQLWNGFLTGNLKTSEVFDIDELAKHYATSDLFLGHHTHYLVNMFFYYNPITSRFQPIGREWESPYELNFPFHLYIEDPKESPEISKLIFQDPIFTKKYIQTLYEYSQPKVLDKFFTKIDEKLKNRINILNKEYYERKFFNSYVYDAQEKIRKKLIPPQEVLLVDIKRIFEDSKTIRIQLKNLHSLPLEFTTLVINNKTVALEEKILLSSYQKDKRILDINKKAYGIKKSDQIKISYHILGLQEKRESEIFNEVYSYKHFDQFDFIHFDKTKKTIHIKEGNWTLEDTLYIPAGLKVVSQKTFINFKNNGSIISESPFYLNGKRPGDIVFTSLDKSGGGILINAHHQEVTFKHVTISNLSGINLNNWTTSGSLTIYHGDVVIKDSKFASNQNGDDLLNIVRSKYKIHKSEFIDSLSDAFDGDYSNGTISNSTFLRSGNDAIDVSRSKVYVMDTKIIHAGDKGISAGENSYIEVDNVIVSKTELALSSKDKSLISGKNLQISDSKVAFSVFKKKSEYGPAKIDVEKISLSNITKEYLIEEQSHLIIDGRNISSKEQDLKKMFYGNDYGKKTVK